MYFIWLICRKYLKILLNVYKYIFFILIIIMWFKNRLNLFCLVYIVNILVIDIYDK